MVHAPLARWSPARWSPARWSPARWSRTALGAVLLLVGGQLLTPGAASAATSYGLLGPSYGSAVTHPPTSDKPQSKLWWNDGSWWATMWVPAGGWHIERLDRAAHAWVDTGVVVDTRATSLDDTLWDGRHLFVASQVATVSTDATPVASSSGQPAKLYRYSYSAGKYTLDAGFPSTINDSSSESLTIDEDSTGAIWATWTQVAGSATAGWTSTVYVNASSVGGATWQAPFAVPGAPDAHPAPDDISAVVAYQSNKIGVMWSDQGSGTVWWAWRTDGSSPTAASSWHVGTARQGSHLADDHLDLKTLQADASGRVFASVKTSLDENGGSSSQAQLVLLVYKPGTGSFSSSTISTIYDCQTRPQVVLDTTHSTVHVFMTGPQDSVTGCPAAGTSGAVYEKTAPMDAPTFTAGRGTPVVQDGASAHVNNVTTSKQSVSSATGLVVLASNNTTKRYWYADESLGSTTTPPPATAPAAGFTATPTSGTAPVAVSFTDTSTGAPTSWAWTFGDGATSTAQNPSHTYTAAGTYTAALTATNAGGSTTATEVVTASAAPAPGTGTVTAGASTTAASTAAVTGVSLTRPAGTAAGDVLVASITANARPSVSSVPAGWSPVTTAALSPNSDASTFVYYHVAAGTDPASWSWTLSSAQKWNAGMTGFHGVDTASPFDTAAVTTVNTGSSTSVSLASVTTGTPGAMLIGGVGLNSTSATVTAPGGWTEAWEGDGAQDAELAYRAAPTAGATGTSTWKLSASVTSAGWVRALRPAGA